MRTLEGIRALADLPLEGRRVLVRADLDLPLDGERVADDRALQQALPTIRKVRDAGGRLVLAGHLGASSERGAASLAPVAERLAELLGIDVFLPDDCLGDAAKKLVQELRAGEVCVLENLAAHAEEEENDEGFARRLSAYADVFVNEAWGASHEARASLDALPRLVPERGMGEHFAAVAGGLARLRDGAERPLCLVLGGARVATQLDVLEALLDVSNVVAFGGATATTLLAAEGVDVGASRHDARQLARARSLLDRARGRRVKLLFPLDVVVAESADAGAGTVVGARPGPSEGVVVDIGPETVSAFAEQAERAKSVLWYGPLGIGENPAFRAGSLALAERLASASSFRVALGGSTAETLSAGDPKLAEAFALISTASAAGLEWLRSKKLPGLEALRGGEA